ncbi:MAG: 1,4-alpha-glucan branching protein GlgB [Bacteroidota bacterium]
MAKKEEKKPAKKNKISDKDLKKGTASEELKVSGSRKKKISETKETEKKPVKAKKKAPAKGKTAGKGTSPAKKAVSAKKTSDKKSVNAEKDVKLKGHDKKALETLNKISLISEYDVHLFKEGKHFHLYKKLGSHIIDSGGFKGVYFALWAPNAREVSVIADFNNWFKNANEMIPRKDESGIWELFIPEAKKGSIYKYFIRSNSGYEAEKGDPFAFMWEIPPNTASVVWDLENTWSDGKWMENRKKNAEKEKPVSAYELHVGSWKRVPEDGNRSLSYKEMAQELPVYLNELGFTHVEFMPVMEHPFFGSWGYQVTGYFAPSSRFGTPQDFMHLIDALHQADIGVILDWVPSHFPSDLHGLHYFDGTFLFEHEDPQKGFHPDWKSYIFNYGRNEVRAFLISNALFWLDKFHADGLRVDAVASMLYLDYSRKDGEWQPNEFGGNEDLEAISFLKEFNEVVYDEFPDTITIAEESTAWPMVSKPTYMGGLGFGMKWMMGWMHDTLEYFQKDPVHRKHHQNTITFSTNYAFTENFMLPLSHDEVVYGKKALLSKMPGDRWNQFANLRTLYSYMFAHPGTKLIFMGGEFGQNSEWDHDSSLEWHLTNEDLHKGIQRTLSALNHLYKTEPALYEKSFSPEGFEWIDFKDADSSIISFLRKGQDNKDNVLVVCNLTPIPRENYRIGVPDAGKWQEIFNSDANDFGGSNVGNMEFVNSEATPTHDKPYSVSLTLPPMAVIYLKIEPS